jgi:hypothetical protein
MATKEGEQHKEGETEEYLSKGAGKEQLVRPNNRPLPLSKVDKYTHT